MDTEGAETILHNFMGGADGATSFAGVIQDAAGNLCGATSAGGAGFGVVFRMTSSGQETVLYTFTGGTGGADGANPDAGLLQDAAGNLYGATYAGGAGSGVIFKPAARRRCSTPSWAAPMARIPMAA